MTTHHVEEKRRSRDWTEAFFAPRAIAIIGASNDSVKISGRPVDYLQRFDYRGRIIPINPTRDTVQGLRAYPSLDSVEGPIDLAMILTNAELSVEALRACADRGIPAAVMVAAGFAEIGGEGAVRQRALEQIVEDTGIRVIGPNCTGFMSFENSVMATFSTTLDRGAIEEQPLIAGNVGLVSQSGGIGGFILAAAQRRGLGISQNFTTGNEVDLSMSEVIGMLAPREDVDLVVSYVEGMDDGDVFISSARTAARNDTPVITLKAGKSAAGAAAVSSHTGALASPGRVFDAVADQYGVVRADGFEELLDLSVMFAPGRRPAGRRLTIVSMSGGLAVMAVDAASDLGLEVPTWSDEWSRRMAGAIPSYGNPRNPIDLTASLVADTGLLKRSLDITAEHPDTDSVLIMIGNTDTGSEHLVEAITDAFHASSRPFAVVWAGSGARARAALSAVGVPVYQDPRTAVSALAALTEWSLRKVVADAPPVAPAADEARAIIRAARAEGRLHLDEFESSRLLAAYGIPSMPAALVETPQQAADAAATMSGRVVVKIASPRIAHKSDIGGVVVGVEGSDEVTEAAAAVLRAAESVGVDDGKILVQAMADPGLELVVGVQGDPVFGQMVVVGLGGTLVEILDDVRMLHAPVSVSQVEESLEQLRAAAVFDGVRGGSASSRSAAAEVVARVSVLADELSDEIAELDINPLIIHEDDAVAVDGLVVLAPRPETP